MQARAGRCGERTERCQWQMKRGERVAAVKILSVRRKAAQKFWTPQQNHRPLRKRYKRCGGVKNPPVTASPCQPPLGKGAEGTGDGLPRVPCALAMTEAERTCVSFRDQSADWSWESVIPLHKGRGERIATASVRTGFAMTWFLQGVRCKSGRADRVVRPYEDVTSSAVEAGRCGHRPLRDVT